MAQIINNKFTAYKLSPEEEALGYLFNENNLYMLQNELAAIAETKLNLKLDPNNPMEFMQQEAFIAGKMDLLSYFLAMHEQISTERSEIAKLVAEEEPLPTNSPTSIFGSV